MYCRGLIIRAYRVYELCIYNSKSLHMCIVAYIDKNHNDVIRPHETMVRMVLGAELQNGIVLSLDPLC